MSNDIPKSIISPTTAPVPDSEMATVEKTASKESFNKSDEIIETHETSTFTSDEEGQLRSNGSPSHPLISFWRRSKEKARYGEVATQPSVFDDAAMAAYYLPPAKYENSHRFDPKLRWTWAEELPLVTKLDWRITLWATVTFMLWDMNRGNLVQALSDNFLDDLGLNTDDFNLGSTVFRAMSIVAEMPMQLLSRKVGIDRFIPWQMAAWSLVSASQFWLNGRTSFLVTRVLLSLSTAGILSNVVLYLTYFYTGKEVPYRMTVFLMGLRINDIFAPLIALGVFQMGGTGGREGWRWLFLIEGLTTLIVALWSKYMLVPSLTQTRNWLHPKGWFTEHQEKILVTRLLRDDPSKSTMHNRQAVTPKLLWEALCDHNLWPLYISSLTSRVPGFVPDFYLTLILRGLGFSTERTNLLSIPPVVFIILTSITATFIAEKTNQRALTGLLGQLWLLPCLTALAVVPASINRWAYYGLLVTLLAYPSEIGYKVAWISRNSNSVQARNVAAIIYGMTIQASLLIASNVYREDDRPMYRRGNRVLVGLTVFNIFVALGVKAYYTWKNKQRERVWGAMSAEERKEYLDNTKDTGSRRLDFRFVS